MRIVALVVLAIGMALVIAGAFLYAPAARQFIGESSRIVFFHVPCAWVSVVAFTVSMLASVRYLRRRKLLDDARAAAAARLGLLFAILATVTGSIFARIMWGAFWNWDPRQTSIVLLIFMYAAYFGLRGAIDDRERRAGLSAAYAIFAFTVMPFLVFVVPRLYWSLHPESVINTSGKIDMDSFHIQVLFTAMAAFTGVFFWLYNLEARLAALAEEGETH